MVCFSKDILLFAAFLYPWYECRVATNVDSTTIPVLSIVPPTGHADGHLPSLCVRSIWVNSNCIGKHAS
jgi:hypothetical protein